MPNNPAYTSTTTQAYTISNPNIVDGFVKLNIEARNLINSIKGGSFGDTSRWSEIHSTISTTDNILSAVGAGTNTTIGIYQSIGELVANDTYFVKTKFRIKEAGCSDIRVRLLPTFGGPLDIIIRNPITNQWYEINQIQPIGNRYGATNFIISATYSTPANSNNKTVEIDGIYGVFLINTKSQDIQQFPLNMLNTLTTTYFTFKGTEELTYTSSGTYNDQLVVPDVGVRVGNLSDSIYQAENLDWFKLQRNSAATAININDVINTTTYSDAKADGYFLVVSNDGDIQTGRFTTTNVSLYNGLIYYNLTTPIISLIESTLLECFNRGSITISTSGMIPITTINYPTNDDARTERSILATSWLTRHAGTGAGTTNKLAVSIGDGILTSYIIHHAFDTRDLSVLIRDTNAPYEMVLTDIEFTTLDDITIKFAKAPSLEEYRVIIIG
jgi:hypothetical protein